MESLENRRCLVNHWDCKSACIDVHTWSKSGIRSLYIFRMLAANCKLLFSAYCLLGMLGHDQPTSANLRIKHRCKPQDKAAANELQELSRYIVRWKENLTWRHRGQYPRQSWPFWAISCWCISPWYLSCWISQVLLVPMLLGDSTPNQIDEPLASRHARQLAAR